MFGHKFPVTTLVVSKAFSTLLSADLSGRVLTWDLNRCEFVREIVQRGPEVKHASICNSTGDIALATGRGLKVFSLNGRLFADVGVCDDDERGEVTSLAWYDRAKGEWSKRNLLLSGHWNGVVKVSHLRDGEEVLS